MNNSREENAIYQNQIVTTSFIDIMDTIEKELGIIAEYDDKLNILNKYFDDSNTNKEVLNG